MNHGIPRTSKSLNRTDANSLDLLRASRDSFEHLVMHSPFGVYAVNADFCLAIVSDGAQAVFRSVRPLLGRDFAEVLRIVWPEPFVSEAIGHFRHTLATGEPYHAAGTVERRQDTADVESYDWKIERAMLPDGRLGAICHFYDLTEREEFSAAMLAEEARFRATFNNAAVGIAHVAPDGSWTLVNRKLCEILGYTEAELLQLTFQDVTYGDDLVTDLALMEQLVAGKIADYELEKRYITKSGELIWAKLTVSSLRKGNGMLDYCITVIEDISQKKTADRYQIVLVDELNHRVKNILATVQAMASHTMRATDNLTTFRETFSGRLRAIAASHDSVFLHGEIKAELVDILRSQLAPYDAAGVDRLLLSGPSVYLSSACAHALGLITHELATNASKYGALSNGAGHITVTWEPHMQADKPMARLVWQEEGGPAIKHPGKPGFGSRLITSMLDYSLGGTAIMEFLPKGLRAEFTFATSDSEDV